MLDWLKTRRRERILAKPFPDAWTTVLHENVWQYRYLEDAERLRLQQGIQLFVATRNWEGCGGLEVTDEVRVTVAAYASLIALNLEPDCYANVRTVLVYPGEYLAPPAGPLPDYLEPGDPVDMQGETWDAGAVILSWADVLASGRHHSGGQNVAVHEFAHQLDRLNRALDGMPLLRDRALADRWQRTMLAAFTRLARAAARGDRTFLDDYAAEDIGEFFAVASEYFFQKPQHLQRNAGGLYLLLRDYFRQDPARRRLRPL